MLLENLGEKEAGARVEQTVIKCLESGKIKSLAAGKMGLTTTEMGGSYCEQYLKLKIIGLKIIIGPVNLLNFSNF